MKASELIKDLTELMSYHGDLPVEYADHMPPDTEHGNVIIDDVYPQNGSGKLTGKITYFLIT